MAGWQLDAKTKMTRGQDWRHLARVLVGGRGRKDWNRQKFSRMRSFIDVLMLYYLSGGLVQVAGKSCGSPRNLSISSLRRPMTMSTPLSVHDRLFDDAPRADGGASLIKTSPSMAGSIPSA